MSLSVSEKQPVLKGFTDPTAEVKSCAANLLTHGEWTNTMELPSGVPWLDE
jgi:hypothetical protein